MVLFVKDYNEKFILKIEDKVTPVTDYESAMHDQTAACRDSEAVRRDSVQTFLGPVVRARWNALTSQLAV